MLCVHDAPESDSYEKENSWNIPCPVKVLNCGLQ